MKMKFTVIAILFSLLLISPVFGAGSVFPVVDGVVSTSAVIDETDFLIQGRADEQKILILECTGDDDDGGTVPDSIIPASSVIGYRLKLIISNPVTGVVPLDVFSVTWTGNTSGVLYNTAADFAAATADFYRLYSATNGEDPIWEDMKIGVGALGNGEKQTRLTFVFERK